MKVKMMSREKWMKVIAASVILLLFLWFGRNTVERLLAKSEAQGSQPDVTILLPYAYASSNSYAFLDRYRYEYEQKTGIKIGFERIMAGNRDKYIMKRNSRLYMREGPTLILIPYQEKCRELVEKGVALNVEGRIPNMERIYSSLVDDFYVPIKMHGRTVSINRPLLEKWGIEEPNLNWTIEEHDLFWDYWTSTEDIYFNRNLFYAIVTMMAREFEFIDPNTEKVNLNTDAVKELVKSIKAEVFSGKYILDESYTYENYYRMFHEMNSQESQDSWEKFISNSARNFIMNSEGHHYNGLTSIRSNDVFEKIKTSLLVPDIRGTLFGSIGFIINRNGKNVDMGLDFLNYLLSDEIQLDIYNKEADLDNSYNKPVNEKILGEIEAIERRRGILPETLELRRYMTDSLREGDHREIFYGSNLHDATVRNRFITELIPFVFADEPYSDEELSAALRKAENELTIYINE